MVRYRFFDKFIYNKGMDFVGIDKFSLLDYDENVSIVLFAPTCNYRCPFCHNGDSVLGSHSSIPFDEILSFLKTRVGLVDAVVVSGGEPTLMDDVVEKIEKIKELGYKIKLDTNGTNPDVLKKLLDKSLINYVAMDIKNSEEMYPATTGVTNPQMDKIKRSISILINGNVDYEFRTTLVAEYHSAESIEKMGKMIKGAKQLYLQKFVDREGVIKKGLHSVEEVWASSYKEILSKFVNKVELRGY